MLIKFQLWGILVLYENFSQNSEVFIKPQKLG